MKNGNELNEKENLQLSIIAGWWRKRCSVHGSRLWLRLAAVETHQDDNNGESHAGNN